MGTGAGGRQLLPADDTRKDFQKISEYGWFVLGFLLFLATVRAFRR